MIYASKYNENDVVFHDIILKIYGTFKKLKKKSLK